jgi:hypothetical protein
VGWKGEEWVEGRVRNGKERLGGEGRGGGIN